MHLPSISVIIFVAFAYGNFETFSVDCSKFSEPCNNNCYAVFVAGKSSTLNWALGGKSFSSTQRRLAGCTPNPCPCPGQTTPSKMLAVPGATSCDEYPYASAVEGGTGAILRCTDLTQNLDEGSALGGFLTSNAGCGGVQCTFNVAMINAGPSSPYCLDGGGANDGFEYTFTGGAYINAKRDAQEPVWELHKPDPAVFLPPHKRREFLLENGEKALLLSTDLESSFDDSTFVFENNGTYERAAVVRELHGNEKSPPFRPSDSPDVGGVIMMGVMRDDSARAQLEDQLW